MKKINWLEELGWDEEQLEELRFTGYAYVRQGKYEIALNIFKALKVLNPDNIYDAQMTGALYLELGKWDEAITALQYSLTLEGNHTPALINLCKALFMKGKITEGLKLAHVLKREKNPKISSMARALILAFSDKKNKS